MHTGSMERTLITKSIRFREFSQWTLATTLIAAGAAALFSASTLEKLSASGDVEIDLSAFRKLGSTSLALDRIDEQQLIQEEARLIDRAAFAAAEALPKTRTAFTKIRLHPKKRAISREMIAKTAPAKMPAISSVEARRLAGSPVVLSAADAEEIAALERAPDPEVESRALAAVYRNLRFQFIAAAENPRLEEEFPAESVAIARANPAQEYDEVPEFDANDFTIADSTTMNVAAMDDLPPAPADFETAPAKIDEIAVNDAPNPEKDSIDVSASSSMKTPEGPHLDSVNALTASAGVMKDSTSSEKKIEEAPLPQAAVISSPGLDLVPDLEPVSVASQPSVSTSTQPAQVKQATGPPKVTKFSENPLSPSLQAKGPSGLDAIPGKTSIEPPTSVTPAPVATAEATADLREYSNDVAAAYQGVVTEDDEKPDYSNGSAEDAIADGDFASARPSANAPMTIATNSARITSTINRAITQSQSSSSRVNYGHGITRDSKGITIDWSNDSTGDGKMNDSELGGKVFVGRPGQQIAGVSEDVQKSLDKFSFAPPAKDLALGAKSVGKIGAAAAFAPTASASPEPTVDTKKCESLRAGVEAFNTGAEKEVLTICRRELSLEGARDGVQARWWESYENETEHWPTLSYLKPNEATATNRIPMLSTASIRILAAISKTNTHTGTGIVFGEVAKGLEIQLLGRSDSPIYLDAGMKVRDPNADLGGTRQFVFLNVEPGQPLLVVKDRERNLSGAIPLVVKSGMATNLRVQGPKEMDVDFTVLDASSQKETRLANLTAEVIGQAGKMGITDKNGHLTIRRVVTFDDFPIYIDLLKNEKSYKNRYRLRASTIAKGTFPLYFFDEKRVGSWLTQLSGGLSPYSGLIAGVATPSLLPKSKSDGRYLKIGILEKKSSLIPERYLLDDHDQLLTESSLRAGQSRYIGVQIPEGPAIPTIVDGNGAVVWSELVYAQPGVINVVNPDL